MHSAQLRSVSQAQRPHPGLTVPKSSNGAIDEDNVHCLSYYSQVLRLGLFLPEGMPRVRIKPVKGSGGPDQECIPRQENSCNRLAKSGIQIELPPDGSRVGVQRSQVCAIDRVD